MIRWIWEEIDRWFSHALYAVRGCQHPKSEPEGTVVIGVDGEAVTLFLETCTVCGVTLLHEV